MALAKQSGERWREYYHNPFGVDARIRLSEAWLAGLTYMAELRIMVDIYTKLLENQSTNVSRRPKPNA